jgi:hypothetical protein
MESNTQVMDAIAASPAVQRASYEGGFYRRLRRIRWLFRYDCRYRLLLMEDLFRRHQIPFEDQKVFELGFGSGDLLERFDHSCAVHGCEVSAEAVDVLMADPQMARYRERRFVVSDPQGHPSLPGDGYTVLIASHVLEHVPDDALALRTLAAHAHPEAHGLFFVPLERPCDQSPNHARTYSTAGFTRLLRQNGWEPVEVTENFRYQMQWLTWLDLPFKLGLPTLGKTVETVKNLIFGAAPASLNYLLEEPLAAVHAKPHQLMVLARRSERTGLGR